MKNFDALTADEFEQLTEDELADYFVHAFLGETSLEQRRQQSNTPPVLDISPSEYATNLFGVLQAAVDTVSE